MKKPLSLMLSAALLLNLLFCAVPASGAEEKEWTVLAYICGSDLESDEGEATDDIREMISSGLGASGAASVLLATGGASRWSGFSFSTRNVQYYQLNGSAPVLLRDVGAKSMGEASTLSDFLRFGISAAPAKRYILILWDHGGGPVYGLCNDENHRDDSLSLKELRKALSDGLQGKKLDIIGFDCCLMNCVDLCGDLTGEADYAVLSQELVSGTGLDYDGWMGPLRTNPGMTSGQVAGLMAETYVRDNSSGRDRTTATMSVIDTEKMPEVMEKANAFSQALKGVAQTNLAGVVRLRSQLTSFGEFLDYDASDLVDVSDMCDAFQALLPEESAGLKTAAAKAVAANYTTQDIAGYAHGLSFFMPYRTALSEQKEINDCYGGKDDAYSLLAVNLASQMSSSGYAMTASSSAPNNLYSYYNNSFSGALYDIWDGYYGDVCSFEDVYDVCGGDIWSGLNASCGGSIWDGYDSCSGIWSGLEDSMCAPSSGVSPNTNSPLSVFAGSGNNIWSGLNENATAEPTASAQSTPQPELQGSQSQSGSSGALENIWAGLLNQGSEYYQPGEANQNLQPGISEAVSAEDLLETAGGYFSSATLTSQMVYSLQLNKEDLNNLASATGVLSRKEGKETIRLGNMGKTTIDWSTGLVYSMFDGSWPMLEGQMVRAEYFYGETEGSFRFVIPARINGVRMYLLGRSAQDGKAELLGATQGYDENGFAIRGVMPLEPGMTILPLFTAVSEEGVEREYTGSEVKVPEEGLKLTWDKIPAGSYLYCFGLTDLSGVVHYTESVPLEL